MDLVSLWMGVVALGAMTIIFRDNPLFHWVEAIVVGGLAGTFLVMGTLSLRDIAVVPLLQGGILYAVPIAIAALQFTTFSAKLRWLARYPVAIMGGVGVGLTLRALINTEIIAQIVPTVTDATIATSNWFNNVSNIYFIVAMTLTILYFMFGYELKGPFKRVNTFARILILIGLGAEAGGTFAVTMNGTSTWFQIIQYLKAGFGIG